MTADFAAFDGQTPLDDVSGLIPNVGTRGELNELEANNVRDAVLKHFYPPDSAALASEFDLAWMKAVHRDMFGKVWKWAGVFRRFDLNLGEPWAKLETRLFDLCESIPHFKQPPGLDDVAYLHHRLVSLHPFQNGNGRWSRLVANVFQIRRLASYTAWPTGLAGATAVSPVRPDYLTALKVADAGSLSNLIRLHTLYTTAFVAS